MAVSGDKLFKQDGAMSICSVSELIEKALELDRMVYFRGQGNKNWQLAPTIARLGALSHAGEPIKAYNLQEQETLLLHRFRRHTYEQRERLLNEWEALFLARHHSLPVRLLDWTSNPLVALYFASLYEREEDNKEDGVIWWFRRPPRKMYVDVFDPASPFEYQGIQIVFPFYHTMRMTAQAGLFTIHSPEYWRDLRDISKGEVKDGKVRSKGKDGKVTSQKRFDMTEGGCWLVPKDKKKEILRQLERVAINHRTLFPELDGLAKGLLQTERFRSPDEYPPK